MEGGWFLRKHKQCLDQSIREPQGAHSLMVHARAAHIGLRISGRFQREELRLLTPNPNVAFGRKDGGKTTLQIIGARQIGHAGHAIVVPDEDGSSFILRVDRQRLKIRALHARTEHEHLERRFCVDCGEQGRIIQVHGQGRHPRCTLQCPCGRTWTTRLRQPKPE